MDITSLKNLVAFLVHFTNAVSSAVENQRFRLADIVTFLELLKDIPGVVQGIQSDIPAWESLSDADKAVLMAEVANLDIQNKTVEELAKGLLKSIVMAGPIVRQWLKKGA